VFSCWFERITELTAGSHDAATSTHPLNRDDALAFEYFREQPHLPRCGRLEGHTGYRVPRDEVDLRLEGVYPVREFQRVVFARIHIAEKHYFERDTLMSIF